MDRKTWVTKFWQRVDQGTDEECWPWTGNRVGHRGILKTPAGHKITAHTAAWMLKNNTRVPENHRVAQVCGFRYCCNPAHLEAKPLPKALYPTAVMGERNGNCKLTDDQVAELRAKYKEAGMTQVQLARLFGITQGQVSRIVRGCNR